MNGGSLTSLTINFAIPIGPSSRILIGDIDADEEVNVQAFDNGVPEPSLANWKEQNLTGSTNEKPVTSDWAAWTTSGDTGTLTSSYDGDLDDPLNVLTPDQDITQLVLTQDLAGAGGVNFQVISPPPSTLTVSGVGTYDGNETLTATLLGAGGTPLAGAPVTFSLTNNGTTTSLPTVTTNQNGVATYTGSDLSGFSAGDYPTGVEASFAGDAKDSAMTASGDLTVGQITPMVNWPNPTGIRYGMPLGAAQLDATASVPGTFDYTPACWHRARRRGAARPWR